MRHVWKNVEERYAVETALDIPDAELNQSVDICCDTPATSPIVVTAFTQMLGVQ
ncbi:hypothetical protein [Scandinavium goeteborgense]|uniref:hypothetical protein n=1 Tax=Scandinavium goeteborgense TaxID=1851514 RepID=UPI00141518C0|nr:hypothetical protein [Scandinavium goeteborgense]